MALIVGLIVMCAGILYGFNAITGGNEDAGGSDQTGDDTAAVQNSPRFAAGAQCIPGTDSNGATISNSAPVDTTDSAAGAIGGMEYAYYALRDGAAVASFMAPTLQPDAASIQQALDDYFPAAAQVEYCLKINPTGDANVSDVQIIESRSGTEVTRVHQQITTTTSADGTHLVSRVVKVD
ncbi:hypothetical protein [Gordonia alkanivorans]|uniref:hypothetical protein n=1 Tax=Gordonia alkanivorans TaxID=84096 RepID=UPI0012DEBCA4|nr:hypothetical protein [Gordonia alkanivorans]